MTRSPSRSRPTAAAAHAAPVGAGPAPVPAAASARRQLPPRRRPAAADDAPSRRLAILLAAEKLFGERGYHAVSIRDIAAQAGVPVALVGYHYGAKHELYFAICESWQGNIEQRLHRLQDALRAPPRQMLQRLVASFVEPLVRLHGDPEGRHYAQLAARELAAPTPEADQVLRQFFDPLAHAYIDALQQLYPARSRGDLAWCYQFMLGATLHFLSDVRVQRLSRGENRPADPARMPTLISFIAAGFRGVLGPAAAAAAPATSRRQT